MLRRKVAARAALHADGDGQQRKLFGADAVDHVEHGVVEFRAEGKLVAEQAEFAADRVGQFASDKGDGRGERMARVQAAGDDLEGERQLIDELLDPPRPDARDGQDHDPQTDEGAECDLERDIAKQEAR